MSTSRRNILGGVISLTACAAALALAQPAVPQQATGPEPTTAPSDAAAAASAGPTRTTTPSGLTIVELGRNDPVAKPGDTVSVHYTGKLEDGTVFDSSIPRGQPFTFTIGEGRVIKGWEEGLVGTRVGAKRQLIIPHELGYGAGGSPPVIPPRATLVFDIEVTAIRPGR